MLERKDVHVRLNAQAMAELRLISDATDKDLGAVAADILERALLGEGHAIRLAAERFARLGICARGREGEDLFSAGAGSKGSRK